MGIDEAGRGPLIGPIVVAGVEGSNDDMKELGVKDSKLLSPGKRRMLKYRIERAADNVLVQKLHAEDIDRLRKKMTMNALEVRAYASIVMCGKSDVIYVDSVDVNEERYANDIKNYILKDGDKREFRIISKHKADSIYPLVSAASIIAKVERDRIIMEIERDIGIKIGSGYPSDPNTIKFVETWVRDHGELPPHVRKSWATADKILRKYGIANDYRKNRTVFDF